MEDVVKVASREPELAIGNDWMLNAKSECQMCKESQMCEGRLQLLSRRKSIKCKFSDALCKADVKSVT